MVYNNKYYAKQLDDDEDDSDDEEDEDFDEDDIDEDSDEDDDDEDDEDMAELVPETRPKKKLVISDTNERPKRAAAVKTNTQPDKKAEPKDSKLRPKRAAAVKKSTQPDKKAEPKDSKSRPKRATKKSTQPDKKAEPKKSTQPNEKAEPKDSKQPPKRATKKGIQSKDKTENNSMQTGKSRKKVNNKQKPKKSSSSSKNNNMSENTPTVPETTDKVDTIQTESKPTDISMQTTSSSTETSTQSTGSKQEPPPEPTTKTEEVKEPTTQKEDVKEPSVETKQVVPSVPKLEGKSISELKDKLKKLSRLDKIRIFQQQLNEFLTEKRTDNLKEYDIKIKEAIKKRDGVATMVWTDMKAQQFAENVLAADEKLTDPRKNLPVECIFIGELKDQYSDTPPEKILSFCVLGEKNKCFKKLCFSLDELSGIIDTHKALNDTDDDILNPFSSEIESKAPELINSATHFSKDFVNLVMFQRDVVKYRNVKLEMLMNKSKEVTIITLVAEWLAEFFKKTPGAMAIGSMFKWVSGKTPEWVKNLLKSGKGMAEWILNNPFWSSLIILLSKSCRLFLCSYIAGITKDDFKMILNSMLGKVASNPIGSFFIELTSALLECAMSVGFVGIFSNPSGVVNCLRSLLRGSLKVVGRSIAWLVDASLIIIKKILEILIPSSSDIVGPIIDTLAKLSACREDLKSCVSLAFGDEQSRKQLAVNQALRGEIFANLNSVLFFGFLFILPANSLTWILDRFCKIIPGGKTLELIQKYLARTYQEIKGKDISVGDLFLLQTRIAARGNIMAFLKELYGWFIELGGCWVKKMKARLMGVEESVGITCCTVDLLAQVKTILSGKSIESAFSKSVASNITSTTSVVNWISDRRLKQLILPSPIYKHKVGNKTIRFYAYRWNPDKMKHVSSKLKKHINVSQVYVGVMAQELQKEFPDAVRVEKDGTMVVKLNKLNCSLVRLICLFNKIPPPSKCPSTLTVFPIL